MSSSTSLKSSVQRHIRTSLLTQYAILSQPAYREASTAAAPEPVEEQAESKDVDEKDDDEDDAPSGKSKGKGGKGGKKSKTGGKKTKKGQEEPQDETAAGGDGEGEVLVIDEIWPKKESMGLTKWYVLPMAYACSILT